MRPRALSLLLLVACGGAPHPPPERQDAGPSATHGDPPPLPSDRALAADATFGDLVLAAVHQDDRRASDSEAGCLLRRTASGFVLDADLSVAVRGLPEAANDLAARAEASGGRARVLTRLGGYGAPGPLVAVALTTIAGAASRTGALLVLTQGGVFVLRTDAAGERDALDVETAAARVAAMDVASVFVTADASTPLTELARLLAALPATLEGRIALAAILPEDAVAPLDDPASVPPTAAICDGLPELADDVSVGEIDASALRGSLASLVPSAQACVATSAAGLGGLVRVAFRIAEDGRVRQACVVEDATGDATLRGCLVDALTTLTFAAPTGGAVDVELPLRLELTRDAAHHQRALCE
jgi:hypothetical protein